jgi:hypothetical protein
MTDIFRTDEIKALILQEFNEPSSGCISDTELFAAINDGYKDVAIKTGCIENILSPVTITGVHRIRYTGTCVTDVQYSTLGTISSDTIGHSPLDGTAPQYWFQWGNEIIIDPVPDTTYSLSVFVDGLPSSQITSDSSALTDLPLEFRICVFYFACYVLAMKLKRWALVGTFYNRYIRSLQQSKAEYIKNSPDKKAEQDVPSSVKKVKNAQRP